MVTYSCPQNDNYSVVSRGWNRQENPPGMGIIFGNDPHWAVWFGYCRDGYNFFALIPTYVDAISPLRSPST